MDGHEVHLWNTKSNYGSVFLAVTGSWSVRESAGIETPLLVQFISPIVIMGLFLKIIHNSMTLKIVINPTRLIPWCNCK